MTTSVQRPSKRVTAPGGTPLSQSPHSRIPGWRDQAAQAAEQDQARRDAQAAALAHHPVEPREPKTTEKGDH
jgi:hypothetical protein